jgi:FkbM family methyltransferase
VKGFRRIERSSFRLLTRPGVAPTEHHGSSYGGHWIPRGLLNPESIVYSGGVGEDVSFDLSLIAKYHCSVFAFDPTPRAIRFAEDVTEPLFSLLPVGLWSDDTRQHFHPPADPRHVSHSIAPGCVRQGFTADCRSIPSLMRELDHERIDLLKLDIEGSEYEVVPAMLRAGVIPVALCIEIHGGIRRACSLVRLMTRHGYTAVAVHGWDVTMVIDS